MVSCPVCSHRHPDVGPAGRCQSCGSPLGCFATIGMPSQWPRFHDVSPAARGHVPSLDAEAPADEQGEYGMVEMPTWGARPRPRTTPPAESRPRGREREREQQAEAGPRYSIQRRRNGRWLVVIEEVGPRGVAIGRLDRRGKGQSAVDRLANFLPEGDDLRVSDLGGGVFRRLREPRVIADGDRFRIGRQTLIFHEGRGPGDPAPGGPPPRLEVLPPGGGAGPCFPLLGPVTVVGRREDQADIALAEDQQVSARHLRLRVAGGRVIAEDLHSRNGSYIHLPHGFLTRPGEVFLVGDYRLRASIRVISAP